MPAVPTPSSATASGAQHRVKKVIEADPSTGQPVATGALAPWTPTPSATAASVVLAKQEFAEQMATASRMTYRIIGGKAVSSGYNALFT